MTVPVDSLAALPQGALFRVHDGRASVEVRHLPASDSVPERIEVTATFDSLLVIAEEYEHTVTECSESSRQQFDTGETHSVEQSMANGSGLKTAWCGFIAGTMAVLIVIVVILFKVKIKK